MSWNKAAQDVYKRNGDRFETDLTDEEWELIEPLLPPPSKLGRHRTVLICRPFLAVTNIRS